MRVTAAADGGQYRGPDPVPASQLARELDALLFDPIGWFAIDARNVRVPGVSPASLDAALALIGRGRVASIVGRLRPGVVAVDVDAGGAMGDLAVESVRSWCAARGLWHLARPSGGGPGRWHVLIVPGVYAAALVEHVAAVRAELRLSSSLVDVRTQVRPLSAPHRRRGLVELDAPFAAAALVELRAVLELAELVDVAGEPVQERPRARRSVRVPAPRPRPGGGSGPGEVLVPLPRPRRELPACWAAYLVHGRSAARVVDPRCDRDPGSRSLIELQATTALVVAGYSEAQAWAAIEAAHETAFTKARSRGRRWWHWQWNRAVLDADAWLRSRRASGGSSVVELPATAAARAELEAVWRSWPARTRHTDVEVYTVVLDRMDRTGATAVQVPQRDLVTDCAVSSRTTVRASLARLQAAGLLVVESTHVRGTTDTADTLALPARFTAPTGTTAGVAGAQLVDELAAGAGDRPGPEHEVGAVSLTGPSRFQPPHPAGPPRPPLELRRALGLPACSVLGRLPLPDSAPMGLPALAVAAGLLDPNQETPSPRQVRTVRGYLQVLASHGLVGVDEAGQWWRVPGGTSSSGDVEQRGRELGEDVAARVARERAAYRAAIEEQGRRARWERARAAAIARSEKARRAAQVAWWGGLDEQARVRRSTSAAAAFSGLSVSEQAARKHTLAETRSRLAGADGFDERARIEAWADALPGGELERRQVERATGFARRPEHERRALVEAWTAHRARWGLPHHRPARTPAGPDPDVELLARPVPDVVQIVDELDLIDLHGHAPVALATAAG